MKSSRGIPKPLCGRKSMLIRTRKQKPARVTRPQQAAVPVRRVSLPPRSETIAIHGGYDTEPTTKAVAVPIYQTVAYEFDSADHGAALFNLEVEGFRYSRISNPTTAVLERRVAELEGGCGALAVSTGQAA